MGLLDWFALGIDNSPSKQGWFRLGRNVLWKSKEIFLSFHGSISLFLSVFGGGGGGGISACISWYAAVVDIMIFLFVLLHVAFSSLTVKLQDQVEEKIERVICLVMTAVKEKKRIKWDKMRRKSEIFFWGAWVEPSTGPYLRRHPMAQLAQGKGESHA